MLALRGSSIGLVPQDPMSNLNPLWKVGRQIKEALVANGVASPAPRPTSGSSSCSRRPDFPMPSVGPGSTPTSSPEACVSAP